MFLLPLMMLCPGVGHIHCSNVHVNSSTDVLSLLDFKVVTTDDPIGVSELVKHKRPLLPVEGRHTQHDARRARALASLFD